MREWSFLTSHARALVCIARDPDVRLREIADALGVTERTAFGIVNDLTEGGYVVKEKDGRRNRYRLQGHIPLPRRFPREPTIGEVLAVLVDTGATEPAQTPDGDGGSHPRGRAGNTRRTKSSKRG
jgi:DNA-binding transcriptional ArsR family regulator